jgi:hypothetical protein
MTIKQICKADETDLILSHSLDDWYKSGYEVYDLEIFDSEFDGYKDYIYIFADGSRLKLNVKNIDNSVNYAEAIK